MKRSRDAEEVDLRAAGSISDDCDRVALDWIQQAINILICLCGQCVIRYIDKLSGSKNLQPDLISAFSRRPDLDETVAPRQVGES